MVERSWFCIGTMELLVKIHPLAGILEGLSVANVITLLVTCMPHMDGGYCMEICMQKERTIEQCSFGCHGCASNPG